MGIQTITGIVQTAEEEAWANRVVEVAFADGYVPLSSLNCVGRTDSAGKFLLRVDNNATEIKPAVLRLPDDSLFGFDLDPEDAAVDLGTLIASGVAGAPRLMPVADGIKVYQGLLTQSGTGDVVETAVFQNTLGDDLVFERDSAGDYRAVITGAFPASKTFIQSPVLRVIVDETTQALLQRLDDNTLQIITIQGGSQDDGVLLNTPVGLLVYP